MRIVEAEGFDGIALELARLAEDAAIATTLVAVPDVEWEPFLELLGAVDALLEQGGLEELFQVVGFHPDAVYEGEDPSDPANAAARAPVAVVHLLRADDMERVIAEHPDAAGISEVNARLLRSLGWDQIPGL